MGKFMEFQGEIQGFHAEIMQDSHLAAWHGGPWPRPLCGNCGRPAAGALTPRKAIETLELPGWLQPVTTLSLVVAWC